MKHVINVNGIKVYAFHGCLDEEGKIGQNYSVDVRLTTNFSKAAATDELIDTIDYVAVNKIVVEEMAIRSKLIEHVGQRILQRLQQLVQVGDTVLVKIVKYCPPINGDVDSVSIEIEEIRKE